MMRAFPRPTFLARRMGKSPDPSKRSSGEEGPNLPSLGYATRGGEKHAVSEDRVFTSTLGAIMGTSESDMTFSDMLGVHPNELLSEEVLVAAVFDGHGGSKCVEFVAESLCDRIAKTLKPDEALTFDLLETAISDGFKTCEDEFLKQAQIERDNSGCCALMAFIHQSDIMIGWTGDCRAVLYDGARSRQLTTDHRPNDPAELKRILENGGKVANNRLNGVLAPSRCFGDLDVRSSNPDGVLISEPSVIRVKHASNLVQNSKTSFLILATDGVWDVLPNDYACEIVLKALKSSKNNPEAAALKLVEEASKLTTDDVSVCVITWIVVPWDVYSGIERESYLSDEGDKQ